MKISKALDYNDFEKRQSDVLVRKRSRIAELTRVKSRTDFLEGAQNIAHGAKLR